MKRAFAIAVLAGLAVLAALWSQGYLDDEAAREPRGPTSYFVYETRFVLTYQGETRTAVWRDVCGAFPSDAPKWYRRFSSGSPGRTVYGCANVFPAIARFSDGAIVMFDVHQNTGRLWRAYVYRMDKEADEAEAFKVDWLRKADGSRRFLKPYPNDAVSPVDAVPYGGMTFWVAYWRAGGPDSAIVPAHPGVPDDALREAPFNNPPKPFVLEQAFSVGICACSAKEACACPKSINRTLGDELMVELKKLRSRSGQFSGLSEGYDLYGRPNAK